MNNGVGARPRRAIRRRWTAAAAAVVAALVLPGVAAGQPAVPLEFQGLAAEMGRRLDEFDAQVATAWDGSRHAVVPAATLLTANGNRGLQLLSPEVLGAVRLELDRLRSLGTEAVAVSVNYPVLDPEFLSQGGHAEAFDGLAAFYGQVAAEVRLRGMKLAVESGAMFPGIYSEGSGLDAAPWFASLSDARYVSGRVAQVVALAGRMHPDVLNVGSEPDTESRLTGKTFLRAPQAFAAMVRSAVDAVAAAGLSGVPIVAGTGTWDPSGSAFVAELAKVPGLWGIDLHVYPVNHDYLGRILSLSAQAHAAGKHVTMLECWLQKVRDSELGTIDSAFDSTLFARDSWDFWEPLDRRFFDAMIRAAHAARIDYVSPFWSRLFFGNLEYATVGAASPPPVADEVIRLASAAAADALRASRTTTTGRGWEALVSGEPGELTVVKTVPIVLDAGGAGGARYLTELTLANRGTTAALVALDYTPATALGASGDGRAAVDLPAGRQLVVADTLAFLRERGLAIPPGNQGGSLRVTFRGVSSPDVAHAGARTTTPSGSGRAGLAYPAVARHDGQAGPSLVFGLRSDAADRTNLALVNTGAAATTLRVTLFSGDAGDYRSRVLSPDVSLGPGQWAQVDRVLDGAGFGNGFARIDVVSGLGPYLAYAVFNDNVTNDGSYVPVEPGLRPSETRLVPVLVESAAFESELVLTNPTGAAQRVTLTYAESLAPAGGAGGSTTVDLLPAEQKIVPRAIDFLRQRGVALGPRGAAAYAGSLAVDFRSGGGAPSSGFAGARTAAPAPDGGAYGLFFAATGRSASASQETWVYGLRQDATTRSNLAVAAFPGSGDVTLRVDVFDGGTGLLAGSAGPLTLAAGAWSQLDGLLRPLGVSNGYARVVKVSGPGRFVAYGVVNDGSSPAGGATNDGSLVVMSAY